jgi:hypothetical protein
MSDQVCMFADTGAMTPLSKSKMYQILSKSRYRRFGSKRASYILLIGGFLSYIGFLGFIGGISGLTLLKRRTKKLK